MMKKDDSHQLSIGGDIGIFPEIELLAPFVDQDAVGRVLAQVESVDIFPLPSVMQRQGITVQRIQEAPHYKH
jgi:hypothetical protein